MASIIDANLEPYIIQEQAPRVVLKIENIAPSRQYDDILDDRVIDDMIVATACALRDKYPQRDFCLLSGDLGVATKALDPDIQLAFKRIPNEWKRGEEEDESQKEIRQLKEEIAKYKKREPDIHIFTRIGNDQDKIDRILLLRDTFFSLTYSETFELEKYLRNKYPIEQKPYYLALKPYRSVIIPKGAYLPIIRITLEEYNNYTEEHNCWFMDTADVFRQLNKKINKKLSWSTCIYIENQGNVPAENVTIRLTAKGKIKIAHYCERDVNKNIISKSPSLPEQVGVLPRYFFLEQNQSKYKVDPVDYSPKEYIEFSYNSLQHQIGAKQLRIDIFAENSVELLNAAIEVEVFAANIPTSIKKMITVQLQKKQCLSLLFFINFIEFFI